MRAYCVSTWQPLEISFPTFYRSKNHQKKIGNENEVFAVQKQVFFAEQKSSAHARHVLVFVVSRFSAGNYLDLN